MMACLAVLVAILSVKAAIHTVDTASVGKVRVSCENEDGWTFDVSNAGDDGADVVSVKLRSPIDASPPNFKVKFEFDAPGTEHVWLSDCDKIYGFWPRGWRHKWLNESSLAHETPVAVAFDNGPG